MREKKKKKDISSFLLNVLENWYFVDQQDCGREKKKASYPNVILSSVYTISNYKPLLLLQKVKK